MNVSPPTTRSLGFLSLVVAMLLGCCAISARGDEPPVQDDSDTAPEPQARWEYYAPVQPASEDRVAAIAPSGGTPPLADVILGPAVFAHARADLADLRLYDVTGQSLPYALRYLRPQSIRDAVSAEVFNRVEPEEGVAELTLDLSSDEIEYNEIKIVTSGGDFRRALEVDGSDDANLWRRLVDDHLVRFSRGEQKIDLDSYVFPASRFRYLRVRVHPDTDRQSADRGSDKFTITEVTVFRHVEIAGERFTGQGTLNARQPARIDGVPGSTWIIDLGGENVPCDQIEVEVDDAEFARDIRVAVDYGTRKVGSPVFSDVALRGEPVWQRRPGDPKKPMVAAFDEVQTSRLLLQIVDHRNPPLSVRAVKFSAAARQIVFGLSAKEAGELRLYFGNPHAAFPNYDFARNLPEKLAPPPNRATLLPAQRNPEFLPPPQPLTERWPWLIYAVLGSVSLVLAAMIASLSWTAIADHDAHHQGQGDNNSSIERVL